MARSKSELERRDSYARRFAAMLAAEGFAGVATGRLQTSAVTIEAEDGDLWDDIVHRVIDGAGHPIETRYQVKRQLTTLPRDTMSQLLATAFKSNAQELCFVCPVPVDVKDVGETRVLSEFLTRLKQSGARPDRAIAGLRDAERAWVEFVKSTTNTNDEGAAELMRRLRIDHVGVEGDIDRRAQNALAPLFGPRTEAAWACFVTQCRDVDGIVEVLASTPPLGLPQQVGSPAQEVYAEVMNQVERAFLRDWHTLVDSLVRAMVPLPFLQDGRTLFHTSTTFAWPGTSPQFEAAFHNLAKRTYDYLKFFETRSEWHEKYLCEDKAWKRLFPNPRYEEESERSDLWDSGCMDRLNNMVVALNEYLRVVRDTLDRNYKLQMGVCPIYDDLGTRGDGSTSTYHVPTSYVEV